MINDLKRCIFNGKIPEPGPTPTEKLKYEVGDVVKCKYEDDWVNGVVGQVWYREELWETGKYMPYQVLLVNGKIMLVEHDTEELIKSVIDPNNRCIFTE